MTPKALGISEIIQALDEIQLQFKKLQEYSQICQQFLFKTIRDFIGKWEAIQDKYGYNFKQLDQLLKNDKNEDNLDPQKSHYISSEQQQANMKQIAIKFKQQEGKVMIQTYHEFTPILKIVKNMSRQTWEVLKQQCTHTQNIDIEVELCSFKQFLAFFAAAGIIYPNYDVQIRSCKKFNCIKTKNASNPLLLVFLKLISILLILMGNTKLIVHSNTAQKHHSQLYQKIDVLIEILAMQTLPQFFQNGTEFRHIQKPFIDEVKDKIDQLELEQNMFQFVKIYHRMKKKQYSTTENIQQQKSFTLKQILDYINIPQPSEIQLQINYQDLKGKSHLQIQGEGFDSLYHQKQGQFAKMKQDLEERKYNVN